MKSTLREVIEWLICIIVAVALALLVRYYLGTPTIVQQTSMTPTLKENERLWLNRWGRTTKTMPERGDIITFEAPSVTKVPKEKIDLNNPVAIYNNEPQGIFKRFTSLILAFFIVRTKFPSASLVRESPFPFNVVVLFPSLTWNNA